MTTTQTTATRTLPFSPLTDEELRSRQDAASWQAVCSLTFHDRHPGTLESDAAHAVTDARLAMELHEAALARTER